MLAEELKTFFEKPLFAVICMNRVLQKKGRCSANNVVKLPSGDKE